MRRSVTIAILLLAAGCERLSDTDAATYLADRGLSHFSELEQINPDNVGALKLAWTYDTNEFGTGISTMQTSPLIIDGVLYGLTPTLNAFALDAATGAQIWHHNAGSPGGVQRGLVWLPNSAAPTLIYAAGSTLIGLDSKTGSRRFGYDLDRLLGASVVRASPGVGHEGSLLLGLDIADRSGAVVAVDVASGNLLWRFDTMTDGAGGAADLAMALDQERGLLFVVTGAPSPAHYGVDRPGDNLYADTVLALDVGAGEVRWHHQVVQHGLWGPELISPPTLVQVARDRQTLDAVAVTTRRGNLLLLDRADGTSLSDSISLTSLPSAASFVVPDLQEVVVPDFDAGASWGGAAFEPGARKLIVNVQETEVGLRLLEVPADFNAQYEYLRHCSVCHGVNRDGLEGDRSDRYGAGGPSLVGVGRRLSQREIVRTIERGRGSMPAMQHLGELSQQAIVRYLVADGADVDLQQTGYVAAQPRALKTEDGFPATAPPWGSLLAVDLDTGHLDWRTPLGDYLAHLGMGKGAENAGGPLLTSAGLVFIAATPDMKVRAFDVTDGSELWQSDLDAGGYATPVSYSVDGRQFVVVAAGGGLLGPPSGSTYAAFALPED
mgnify:CR=1 FL=1